MKLCLCKKEMPDLEMFIRGNEYTCEVTVNNSYRVLDEFGIPRWFNEGEFNQWFNKY